MQKEKLFSLFYERYYDRLRKSITDNNYLNGNPYFKSVYESLYNELFSLSYMTLVYELNNLRDKGVLNGDTSEERYLFFEKMIGSESFFEYIQDRYPVLIDLMESTLEHFIKAVDQIVIAFYKDKKILKKTFGRNFDQIEDIQIGIGDTHKIGDSVAILKGDFGEIVYKPNKLTNDAILNDLIDLVNPLLSVKIKKISVVHFENHGWQEFIKRSECKDETEVKSFYRRLGYYLSLFYILNSCDFHYENIIASGEYPYAIDLETLITTSAQSSDKEGNLYNLLQDNVLRSGLLPTRTQDSYLDVDLSGFSGGEIQSSKHKIYEIKNVGTDQMVVREEILTGETKKTHKPYIQGKSIEILDYVQDFIAGFRESMSVLLNIKADLLKWISSDVFEESSYRQVLRPTYVYGKILNSSHYPIYLIDIEQRKKLFSKLINPEENKKSKDEIKALLKENIPAYECYYTSKDLFRNKKLVQKNYFSETPKEVTKRKINSLSEKTIDFQVRLIECSMLTILNEPVIQDEYIRLESSSNFNLEDSFRTIYEEIISYEVALNDNMSDLFQTRIIGDKYMLSGSNFSLYEGGGLIWSLFCYGIYSEDNYIIEFAKRLLNKAEINYGNLKKETTCSPFSDTAGAMYLYYNFYFITKSKEYHSKFKVYLKKYILEIEQSLEIDYVSGVSGAIHLLSNLYRETSDSDLEKSIAIAIDKFEQLLENEMLESIGIAHGRTGIAIALMDCYDITGKYLYLEKVCNILLEDSNLSYINNKSWCNGLGGVLLVYANILTRINIDEVTYRKILFRFHKYLEKYLLLPRRNNIGLCHGSSGELETMNTLLFDYRNLLSQDELILIEKEFVELSKYVPVTNGNNLGVPLGLTMETFMTGSSGVAYTQLRIKKREFPSVFMLEVAKDKSLELMDKKLRVIENILS